MSDFDPNRMDPNRPPLDETGYASERGFNWSWIIGGIAAILVLIVALSFLGHDDRTADTGSRPVTTGQGSSPMNSPMTSPNSAPAATPAPIPAERTAPPRPANPNQ